MENMRVLKPEKLNIDLENVDYQLICGLGIEKLREDAENNKCVIF
jgi:hypothetical protein